MAKLKNFTLDGKALRMVAYEDHHGVKHYEVALLPGFTEKAMTGEKLVMLANALKADVVELDGVLDRYGGKFTDKTLFRFIGEVKDDQQEVGT
jgi:hypothetical protein